jgi:chromatin remodeling complex protein RSC6
METASGTKKKSPAKKAAASNGFMKPLTPSKALAEIVGDEPLPRSEAVSKMWAYIKEHKLQNEKNKREIIADEKLQAVFDHKPTVNMFEMNKHLARHLK